MFFPGLFTTSERHHTSRPVICTKLTNLHSFRELELELVARARCCSPPVTVALGDFSVGVHRLTSGPISLFGFPCGPPATSTTG